MNREILFRAKTYDDKWHYGYIDTELNTLTEHYMPRFEGDINFKNHNIWIETVGQYIGLKDKNGKKIFEGDIVRVYSLRDSALGTVFYNDKETAFCFRLRDEDCSEFETKYRTIGHGWYGINVLGNVHDNPELLQNNKGDNNE